MNKTVNIYSARNDSMNAFIDRLRSLKKGNVLIVGHSNTIDDLANKLTGTTVVPGDLPETQYDNLYEIKRKGKRFVFRNLKYGTPTP
jgi:broad specificity phosphatase PhoE